MVVLLGRMLNHVTKMSPHLLIVAQKASVFNMAIEQQSKIEGGYTPTVDTIDYQFYNSKESPTSNDPWNQKGYVWIVYLVTEMIVSVCQYKL